MLQVYTAPFPVLTTERLRLRAIDVCDVDEVYAMRSDPEMMKYIGKPLARSKDEIADLIRSLMECMCRNESIVWAITQSGSDKLIGSIAYWRFLKEHYRAEVGYMLMPACQGMGLMQEAFAAVLHYGFATLGLHTIEANIDPLNERSIKLLERNGFVREAHYRENYFFEGKFIDSVIYSRIAP